MLVFCTVGVLLVGSLVGIPLSIGAALFSIPQEDVLKWLTYSAPIWAPIGFGMGSVTASLLVRGLRRKDPAQDNPS
jgi:hypothetical protein